jgi:hypothetical protein
VEHIFKRHKFSVFIVWRQKRPLGQSFWLRRMETESQEKAMSQEILEALVYDDEHSDKEEALTEIEAKVDEDENILTQNIIPSSISYTPIVQEDNSFTSPENLQTIGRFSLSPFD